MFLPRSEAAISGEVSQNDAGAAMSRVRPHSAGPMVETWFSDLEIRITRAGRALPIFGNPCHID
jgi:hypothetical protein